MIMIIIKRKTSQKSIVKIMEENGMIPKKNVKLNTRKKGHIMKMMYVMTVMTLIDIQKFVSHGYLKIKLHLSFKK
jgi:hypothetical protein